MWLLDSTAEKLLELQLLPELGPYDIVHSRTQQTYGKSRVNSTLSNTDLDGSIAWFETKNCLSTDYYESLIPADKNDVCFYTEPMEGFVRHAI
jgi:hypothetical protein